MFFLRSRLCKVFDLMVGRGTLAVWPLPSLIRGLQHIATLVKRRRQCVTVVRDLKWSQHRLYWKNVKNLRLKCCNLNFQPPLSDHWSHWFVIYRGMNLGNHQELSRIIPSLDQLTELELHCVLVTEGRSLAASREMILLCLCSTLRLNKNLEILISLLNGICLICVPLGHI